jgi:hypothetical protein
MAERKPKRPKLRLVLRLYDEALWLRLWRRAVRHPPPDRVTPHGAPLEHQLSALRQLRKLRFPALREQVSPPLLVGEPSVRVQSFRSYFHTASQ